ncbi:hypothetical protein [Nitrosopumilus sp.]|uniref:hypothetical protein n=1 Tax=Nitrosopumilus sp. TaxID=2024843 RepID=UPI0026019A19|nr:hypothetical protein [Nitrosopumilus sp.]
MSSTPKFLWTLDGLIPNAVSWEENFSVAAVPSTWVRGLCLQKWCVQSQAGS